MIKFEHTEVVGWEHAIRGMRNPMNSWEKSDSGWTRVSHEEAVDIYNDDSIEIIDECDRDEDGVSFYIIGKNDRDLMIVPFPVSWTVKMKKKQKETQDILSYHSQAAGCSDKARAKASGGRQPIEECGRTGL